MYEAVPFDELSKKNVHGSKWIRPEKRAAIYHRDGGKCVYCGSHERLSLDHVVPRELGGTHEATNLVTACVSCNSRRQDTPLKTWIQQLHKEGADVKGLGARIKSVTAKSLDMKAGKQAVADKKSPAPPPAVEAHESIAAGLETQREETAEGDKEGSAAGDTGDQPRDDHGRFAEKLSKAAKRVHRVELTHRTKAVAQGTRRLDRKLRPALKAIARQCAAAATKHAGLRKAEEEDERKPDEAADAAIGAADWTPIAVAAQAELEAVARDGAKRTLAILGVDDDETITSQTFTKAVDWAKARAAELVGRSWDDDGELVDNPDAEMAITDSLREEIRAAVADALERGDSAADLSDAIEGLSGFAPARATMIARTEIIRSHANGQLRAMRESGVVDKKAWSTSNDGDVDEECEANEDEGDIGIDDDFQSGDDAPPAHPNCRCVVVAVIESADDQDDDASDEDDDTEEDDAAE